MIVIFGEKNSTLKTIYLGGNKINAVNLRSKKNELSRYEIEIVI